MIELFYECSSLKYLPDISKWEMKNVKYIDNIFKNCSSLLSIPDISKWNINNLKRITNIFKGCISLISFPDISKWNLININDISNMINSSLNSSSSSFEDKDYRDIQDSNTIDSSGFLNKQDTIIFNNINENEMNFSQENNSLNEYYENFYL